LGDYEKILAGGGGLGGALVRAPLWLCAHVYGPVVRLRNAAFDHVLSVSRRVSVPVISVGNITAGGTGKTPLVIDLVHRLRAMGHQPAVVSRGYKATEAGADELLVVRRHCPEVVCVADADRARGAQTAIADHNADVIVLDDGFQHRRIRRDLDIVLIDATRPFGYEHILPRGLLREPLSSLQRAQLIVLSRCDLADAGQRDAVIERIGQVAPDVPVVRTSLRPQSLRSVSGGSEVSADDIDGPVHLLCGIGHPQAFKASVERMGIEVARLHAVDDHHAFTADEMRQVLRSAERAGAKGVIITEKDAVKIEKLADRWPDMLLELPIRIDFEPADDKLVGQMLTQVTDNRMGR